MTKPIDHVAYLSQEIGARPAGTEEEQQAALYIADKLQNEAHLNTEIEDFTCLTGRNISKAICYVATILVAAFSLVLPEAVLPAIVVSILATVLIFAEYFDKPLLSRLFMKGVSQNVVAKYEPAYNENGSGKRRRKIIVVANYDSGKVRPDLAGFMIKLNAPLQIAALVCMVLVPLVLMVRNFLFPGATGEVAMTFAVVTVLLLAVIAVQPVLMVIEKLSAYNEAANSNASGVSVLLEVARRLGNGLVQSEPRTEDGVVYGEEAARSAGVIPEGATVRYETADGKPLEGLAAAKAAIAAMTGEGPALHVTDIASNLVQVKDEPIAKPTDDEMRRSREEAKAALSALPADTLDAVRDANQGVSGQVEQKDNKETAAAVDGAVAAGSEQGFAEAEKGRMPGVVGDSEASGTDASAGGDTTGGPVKPVVHQVPDWYKKATEKARKKDAAAASSAPVQRSRYADVPADDAELDKALEAAKLAAAAKAAEADRASEMETAASASAAMTAAFKPLQDAQMPHPAQPVQTQSGQVAQPDQMPVQVPQPVQAQPQTTTAMPPISAGNLDLEALRAIGRNAQAASSPVPDKRVAGGKPAPAVQSGQPDRPVQASRQVHYAAVPAAISSIPVPAPLTAEVTQVLPANLIEDSSHADGAYAADASARAVASASAPMPVPAPAASGDVRIGMFDLPALDLPPIDPPQLSIPVIDPVSPDDFKQRAPLAFSGEEDGGKAAAKDLLAVSLPAIDLAGGAEGADPASSDDVTAQGHAPISATGSFAPIASSGAGSAVGDDFLADVDPDDLYVDDADDSVYDTEYTETGAFAGPGYVDVPQSRFSKFFGKFRRKKKQEDTSAQEWLGVDSDFDARSVGKARGGWESFRDDDDWEGGAFSNHPDGDGRAGSVGRGVDGTDAFSGADAGTTTGSAAAMPASSEAPFRYDGFPSESSLPEAVGSAYAASAGASGSMDDSAPAHIPGEASDGSPYAVDEAMGQIYSFAAGDINTEVWFVALGSELMENGGIKAFLAEHAAEMRGAVIVNLEALGAGEVCTIGKEGLVKRAKASARMSRYLHRAAQSSGVRPGGADINWRDTAASYALKHRLQAIEIVGMDGAKPAYFGEEDDIVENIDPEMLDRNADFVVELLKNI